MNPILKISAALLMLIAVGLAFLAFFIAKQPAPAPAPVASSVAEPVVQQAMPAPPQTMYTVMVAAENLAAGSVLTAASLTAVQWPMQPANTYIESQDLLGQTLRLDVPLNEPITQHMLAQGLAKHLNSGERAVSVAIDELSGAMQHVSPGDVVDVFFSAKKDSEVADTQARLLLPQARVLAYGAASVDGPIGGTTGTDQTKGKSGAAASPARHAMLAVPLAKVNELLLASRHGSVQLVLRSPEDLANPDMTLFQSRDTVLKAKAGLNSEERQQLHEPENLAYAGDSLAEFTASPSENSAATASAPRQGGGGRSLEVIRAGRSERVPY
ncbi:MAG: Flp pilus assembly protein CpaB [Burkholderiaceae bacterium]|nr:Flp pilus assembly protein CpaB [Burkholderiaceae bacterium]